jgi:hypothetical protein
VPVLLSSVARQDFLCPEEISEMEEAFIGRPTAIFLSVQELQPARQDLSNIQAHLSQPHDQDWLCPLPRLDADMAEEQAFFFDTTAQFQDHLNLYHPNLDTSSTRSIFQAASQLAVLPQYGALSALAEQTTAVTLQKHLANHLELAFLLAVPGRDDIEDSDTVSSGRPSS